MIDKHVSHIRTAHGALMSVAFLALKPAGAILIRALSGRCAFETHVVFQSYAAVVAATGAGLGIYVANAMDRFGKAHVIIGFVTMTLMVTQALLGHFHHRLYVKLKRKTLLGTTHVWLGRLVMVGGITNGGIGLSDANNTTAGLIAYIVLAVVDVIVYLALHGILMYQRKKETHVQQPLLSGS